jgi:hypothetical protein
MGFPQLPKSNDVMDESGNHIQFGEADTFSNPPGFNPGDNNAAFNPQPFGRGIVTDSDDDNDDLATGRA